jgi:hypothetical protein
MAYTSGRLYAGETTGVTVTAVAVSSTTAAIREALIQADPTNTTNVLVGNATAQEVVLTPGQSITIPIFSLSLVYVKMASGTGVVNWLARD